MFDLILIALIAFLLKSNSCFLAVPVLRGDEEEKRHLQSRKTYYFRCCFWSSLKRPDKVPSVASVPSMVHGHS